MRRFVGAFAGALAAALIVANVASAETVVHELNTPFAIAVLNECTKETVEVEGTFDAMITITESSSGAFHNKVHVASKGEGLGILSRTRYIYSDEFNFENTAAGAVTTTQTVNHFITSVSSTDNAFLKITSHVLFNGTHPPAILVDKFEMGCRG